MNRRKFLKKSFFTGSAALIAPGLISKNTIEQPVVNNRNDIEHFEASKIRATFIFIEDVKQSNPGDSITAKIQCLGNSFSSVISPILHHMFMDNDSNEMVVHEQEYFWTYPDKYCYHIVTLFPTQCDLKLGPYKKGDELIMV